MTALYLERFMNYGLTPAELRSGRPIIGIAQTGSDLSPCNRHHLELATRLREGIREAGGIAVEFPVHPIQETGKRPTAGLDRNLAYLGLVETLYGYPIDGVILTIGCDKTTPALLMAAATVNIPAIALSVGPMLNGWFRGERVETNAEAVEIMVADRAGRPPGGEVAERAQLDDACGDRLPRHRRHRQLGPDGDVLPSSSDGFVVPDCSVCGGMLKPDVVFFGEYIPVAKFAEAEQLVHASDALLVAGSSLVVNSGIRLLERARRRKLPIVIVNRGQTRGDGHATVKIDAGTSEVLRRLAQDLPGR